MLKLWTHKTLMEYRGEQRWAKLRVKTDDASGEDYFDILVGKNGQGPHAHLGIALDHSLLFAEYRGVVQKMAKRIESQQKGVLETQEAVINPNAAPAQDLIFKVNIDTCTGETTIVEFALKE
ncbi:MAG: hypothetical protein ACR2IF_13730 [Terriglobales bacterium]